LIESHDEKHKEKHEEKHKEKHEEKHDEKHDEETWRSFDFDRESWRENMVESHEEKSRRLFDQAIYIYLISCRVESSFRVELSDQASQLDSSAWIQLLNSTQHFSKKIPIWLDTFRVEYSTRRDQSNHRIQIRKSDKWKITFHTRYDQFKYQIMLFELINASAIFQFYVNHALKLFMNICYIIYLNDVLIYFETKEQHWKHVCKILCTLLKYQLYIKLSETELN